MKPRRSIFTNRQSKSEFRPTYDTEKTLREIDYEYQGLGVSWFTTRTQ